MNVEVDSSIVTEEDGRSCRNPEQQEEPSKDDKDSNSEASGVGLPPGGIADTAEGDLEHFVVCCGGKWDSDGSGRVSLSCAEQQPIHAEGDSLAYDQVQPARSSCWQSAEDDISYFARPPFEKNSGEQENKNERCCYSIRSQEKNSIDSTASERRFASLPILTFSPTPELVTDSEQALKALGARLAVLAELHTQFCDQFGFKSCGISPPVPIVAQSAEHAPGMFVEFGGPFTSKVSNTNTKTRALPALPLLLSDVFMGNVLYNRSKYRKTNAMSIYTYQRHTIAYINTSKISRT